MMTRAFGYTCYAYGAQKLGLIGLNPVTPMAQTFGYKNGLFRGYINTYYLF